MKSRHGFYDHHHFPPSLHLASTPLPLYLRLSKINILKISFNYKPAKQFPRTREKNLRRKLVFSYSDSENCWLWSRRALDRWKASEVFIMLMARPVRRSAGPIHWSAGCSVSLKHQQADSSKTDRWGEVFLKIKKTRDFPHEGALHNIASRGDREKREENANPRKGTLMMRSRVTMDEHTYEWNNSSQ